MNRETELALIHALKRGDEAAFDTIYEAYRARVFAFLLRLGRNRPLAEDLLEETWLRLVSRVHTLADDSRLLPWLLTVARNLFLSHRRTHLLHTKRQRELVHLQAPPEHSGSPFEAAAGHELEQQIERALQDLPFYHREALLLIALEGLTPAQAAEVCGVSSEAMRQRLSRARSSLARKLSEYGVEIRTPTAKNARLVRHV